jgi:hypothetical protein
MPFLAPSFARLPPQAYLLADQMVMARDSLLRGVSRPWAYARVVA